MKTHRHIARIICIVIPLAGTNVINAQPDTTRSEMIAVVTRSYPDSILLRWAPLTYTVWRAGNDEGYRIERYVISQDGKLISENKKQILESSIRPYDEAQWEDLVRKNRYAAIAAQALFGDRFEVDLTQSDVVGIVNKVKENEQRFAFALFSADISPPIAKACGLWYADKTVVPGEKYLYRIIANGNAGFRGSVYIGTADKQYLPPPQNLKGEFQDGIVSLRWHRVPLTPYTAFSVQRSLDGRTFDDISDTPIVTLSPESTADSRYEYATDSLPDNRQSFHYRVKGITPFGEEGPTSNVVSGRAIPSVEQVPYILSAANINNTSILVKWDFPETSHAAISGFDIERSPGPEEKFVTLNKQPVSSAQREFEDTAPGQVNYYRIQAHGLDGVRYSSHVYFAQLVDSIPPLAPTELTAIVDDAGKITLSWKPNDDRDIYGYRVYRSYQTSEEPAQITKVPIQENHFLDSIDLNTLNEQVHYRLMAVDVNQNHSSLSGMLSVSLPDKVRPQPPVILPGTSDTTGIVLTWIAGASDDIVSYKIYRKHDDEPGWLPVGTEVSNEDSIYRYIDQSCPRGIPVHYTVLSVDDAGLESVPAHPVTRVCTPLSLPAPAAWKRPTMVRDQNQVKLAWIYDRSGVSVFRIFRSVNNGPPILHKSLAGKEREYTDTLIPGNVYGYRIMAFHETGGTSALSDVLKLEF